MVVTENSNPGQMEREKSAWAMKKAEWGEARNFRS
jgi:hypothetical protein